jgi:hypothetical protein
MKAFSASRRRRPRSTPKEQARWIRRYERSGLSQRQFAENVSGQSKPASKGRMKTSHFEGRIALSAEETAQGRDEHTQRELATFDFDIGGAWLVTPADCA